MMQSDNIKLEVRDLHTQFEIGKRVVHAVNGVSFNVYDGEMLGIVGESGSGKSVTIQSVLGLVKRPGKVTRGEVFLDGNPIHNLPEREMRKPRGTKLAMIFQEPLTALNPSFTIGWQIDEVYKLHRREMSRPDREGKVREMLEKVKIPDAAMRMKEYPHQFSGGMRQRGLIAIALACQPDILFADEPTTALDVTVQADIMDLIQDLREDMGLTVVFISHNINLVTQRCDRVIVMYAGRIVEEASSEQLIHNPRHPYTVGLIHSIPDIEHPERPIESIPGDIANLDGNHPGCPFSPRCHRACEICRTQSPQRTELEPGHWVSCHCETLKEEL